MKQKTVADLVLEYIDSIPVQEFATRKNMIAYVNDNIEQTNCPHRFEENNGYSTIDNYRNICCKNNILQHIPGKLGIYLKINEVPKASMCNLLIRANTGKPYYEDSNGMSIFGQDLLKELL